MHLRVRYFRPSWQGGDTEHPKCMAPRVGWAGEHAASEPMTDDPEHVTCGLCVATRAIVLSSAPQAPPRRPNRHDKHLKAIWKASHGMMFPYCVERRAAVSA